MKIGKSNDVYTLTIYPYGEEEKIEVKTLHLNEDDSFSMFAKGYFFYSFEECIKKKSHRIFTKELHENGKNCPLITYYIRDDLEKAQIPTVRNSLLRFRRLFPDQKGKIILSYDKRNSTGIQYHEINLSLETPTRIEFGLVPLHQGEYLYFKIDGKKTSYASKASINVIGNVQMINGSCMFPPDPTKNNNLFL